MKHHRIVNIFIALLIVCSSAEARDTTHNLPVADPMSTSTAEGLANVRFFFGEQQHPTVLRTIGTYSSRKTTNAFGKSDKTACDWAFLSAIKSFWDRASRGGGNNNAVINIRSITTGATVSSESEYVCRAGNVVAKVYLEGTFVELEPE